MKHIIKTALVFIFASTSIFSLSEWDEKLLEGIDNSDYKQVVSSVQNGADVNVKDGEFSALLVAIKDARDEDGFRIVEYLISKGADVNENSNSWQFSPLVLSVQKQRKRVFDLLIQNKKVDINLKNRQGFTALFLAVQIPDDSYYTRELIRAGAKVNLTAKTVTPLYVACSSGNYESVHSLVKAGANINVVATVNKSSTPLMRAVMSGNSKIVKLLLEKGADRNAQTTDGETALSIAEKSGHDDIAQLLKGAEKEAEPEKKKKSKNDKKKSKKKKKDKKNKKNKKKNQINLK